MHPIALLALLMLVLTGCATPAPYGNFAGNPATVDQAIARDAVRQLVALYPPAKTRLALQQPIPDPFGAALVAGLRQQGYALLEFHPQAHKATPNAEPARAFRYVLDAAGRANLYRLTLWVGMQSLSRAYQIQDDTGVPAGYWVRKR